MTHTEPDGTLAVSSTGTGDPVLVLHAWWGLNDTIKAFCARLAEAGFTAFAPDLYHGDVTTQIAEAEALSTALGERVEQARADIAEAATFVIDRAGQADRGLTVIGFSLGAYYALDLSVRMPDRVRSVVVFYGTGPADFQKSQAAYLGHFAENDPYESPSDVNWLESELQQAGRPVTFYRYAGVGHWFFEPDRTDAYDEAAANLAWERTLAFLRNEAD